MYLCVRSGALSAAKTKWKMLVSGLFGINLGSPCKGQSISSIGSPTICLQGLFNALQSPVVGGAAAEAQREN